MCYYVCCVFSAVCGWIRQAYDEHDEDLHTSYLHTVHMEIRVQWMRLFEVISCGCVSESRFGRQTRVIQTDFTEGHHIYPAITEDLKDLEIGILGNLSYDRRCVPSNTF